MFLKADLFPDFFPGEPFSHRSNHPFFLHVVFPVDDGDHFSCKLLHRLIDPQEIGVLLFPVRGLDAPDIAVIDGIKKVGILWVMGSQFPVYRHGDNLT